jgi:RimJ/RimL family protein N-acetyltransferase
VTFPLPEPALTDGVVLLRPWRPQDASALAAAWHDPEMRRWLPVPPGADPAVAARWIALTPSLRTSGRSLDLVISDPSGDVVHGEVGCTPGVVPGEVAIGWWVAPESRGSGLAARSLRLFVPWVHKVLGKSPIAVIDPGNAASLRVAAVVGVTAELVVRSSDDPIPP